MSDPHHPILRRADHIGFAVASLDETLRFWVEGLGADLVRTGEMGGEFLGEVTGARGARVRVAIVEVAGQTVELLEYSGTAPPAASTRPSDPGFAHLAFAVEDLDAVLARIAPFGWRPQGVTQTMAAGPRAGTRVMYVRGPDGATLELLQPPA